MGCPAHWLWLLPEVGKVSVRLGQKSRCRGLRGRWGQSPGGVTVQCVWEHALLGPALLPLR